MSATNDKGSQMTARNCAHCGVEVPQTTETPVYLCKRCRRKYARNRRHLKRLLAAKEMAMRSVDKTVTVVVDGVELRVDAEVYVAALQKREDEK
jgi:DNA-directed RNA polymerase subunit RPC12/RpoP